MAKKIDILKHVLVPKVTVLSEKEVKQLFKDFNITAVQLPSMLAKDPLAKALDLKPNDILKIERKGPSGKDFYYRRVVE